MALSTIGTNAITDATIATGDIADNAVTTAKTNANITMMDQWIITSSASYSGSQNATAASNWARNTNDFSGIGTGMTESSGVFTFPQTGLYAIEVQAQFTRNGAEAQYVGLHPQFDSGDNSFANVAENYTNIPNSGDSHSVTSCMPVIDVTDVANQFIRFQVQSNNSFTLNCASSLFRTGVTFIRLGDT